MKTWTFCGAILLVVCLLAPAYGQASVSVHLTMGNPSKAQKNPAQKTNFLHVKEGYVLSYNDEKGTPNWVSWHLAKSFIGAAPRRSRFQADDDLPPGFTIIRHNDYLNSGFDRGHLCPHCDRSKTEKMSFETFTMTNVIPQSAEVNEHAWNQFEFYCRTLVVNEGKELYVISGPHGVGGRGKNGFTTDLADGKVTVPAECWKVVLILDEKDGDDTARIDEDTRLIAVAMPNDDTVGEDWGRYRTSVHKLEKLTGHTFFDLVPGDIMKELKKQTDDGEAPIFQIDHNKGCLKQATGE